MFVFLVKQNQSQEHLDSISVLEVARALLTVLEFLPFSTSLNVQFHALIALEVLRSNNIGLTFFLSLSDCKARAS